MKLLALTGSSDLPESALLAGLKGAGVEVRLLGNPQEHLRARLAAAQVAVQPFNCRCRFDPGAILQIRRLLLQERFDAVHAFTNSALSNLMLAALISPKIKKIGYRGTTGHINRYDPSAWLTYLNPRLDAIMCVSEAVRAYLMNLGIAPAKLATIYKGHDRAWYKAAPRSQLQEFGIPQDAFVIACTANIRPVKGVDTLIEAAHFHRDNARIHYLLIGAIKEGRLLRRQLSKAPQRQIHLAGYRSDAAALVGACDVFVMPSRAREGMPKALIEAMVQGIPPIVTAVGGMTEVVRPDIDGLVVPPDSARELAAAIGDLFNNHNKRRQLAQQAAARIENEFNIRSTVNQTLALYKSIS